MTTNHIDIDAPPTATHATITDADTYPHWLIAVKRIRTIEPDWPREGSSFHHCVGVGPFTIKDRTTVVSHPDEGLLELRACIGPLGATRVTFRITALDGGRRSHLAVEEDPSRGLVQLLWRTPARALVSASVWGRNAVSLHTLREMVEARHRAGTAGEADSPADVTLSADPATAATAAGETDTPTDETGISPGDAGTSPDEAARAS